LLQSKEHAGALAAPRQAIRIDLAHAAAHNGLGWQLLTGPKELRDPREALLKTKEADPKK
jgi:hypothetical protein